ncbi:hypothetical protein ABH928_004853 [Streptacidiphilus sp. MAP5-3]
MIVVSEASQAMPDPEGSSTISSQLVDLLVSQGEYGERAARLLQAAQRVLADEEMPAAEEVAQSCCRGALDALLKMAGEDFPGVLGAQKDVIASAKQVVAARQGDEAGGLDECLERLEQTVAALEEQESDKGGFRIRQVGQLVHDQTGWEMGPGERLAVDQSWNRFYRETSGVLHGSRKGQGARRTLEGVTAAIGRLFHDLMEDAAKLRSYAQLEDPSPADAEEVKLWSDPRAGAYFFAEAVSAAWLDLLPLQRFLPQPGRWPAQPYLKRLLAGDPELVCAWFEGRMDALAEADAEAVVSAVMLLWQAGIDALRVMRKALGVASGNRHVLVGVAEWAQQVPVSQRNRTWVQVVEEVLAANGFARSDTWQCGQLLVALLETAYPGGSPRGDGGKLATGVRHALATTLAAHLGAPDQYWTTDLVNDLRQVAVDDPTHHVFLVPLTRAVLDLAAADAAHGVDLGVRTKPLMQSVPTDPGHRLRAVHLLETGPTGTDWWTAAVEATGQVVALRSPRADVFDFLVRVMADCPQGLRADLEEGVLTALGPVPSQADIDAWVTAHQDPAGGQPLNDRWYCAWSLASVLPSPVSAAWQPVVSALQNIAGAPTRPEPLLRVDSYVDAGHGMATETFLAQAHEHGPAAAAAALTIADVPGDDADAESARAQLLAELVSADPERWAEDPEGVLAALVTHRLRHVYLYELISARESRKLDGTGSLT